MNPLVSISVITYNSSKYVLDTLESVKAQTYPNLELVVSDDCSTDNTVEICRNWIEQNKNRFVNAKVIVASHNSGISANYNQGMDNCSGEWIKEVAGDDMLLPNCVEDYMNFIKANPESYFCFGKAVVFDGDEERRAWANSWFDYEAFKLPSEEQYKRLMTSGNFICSTTYFYNRQKAIEYEIRNDEEVPFIEDWPKWIKILKTGNKLSFVDQYTAKYRLSSTSLSSQHEPSPFWIKQKAIFSLKYIIPYRYEQNPRKAWRLKQYALQDIEPHWWRKMLMKCYEAGASLYRLVFSSKK